MANPELIGISRARKEAREEINRRLNSGEYKDQWKVANSLIEKYGVPIEKDLPFQDSNDILRETPDISIILSSGTFSVRLQETSIEGLKGGRQIAVLESFTNTRIPLPTRVIERYLSPAKDFVVPRHIVELLEFISIRLKEQEKK